MPSEPKIEFTLDPFVDRTTDYFHVRERVFNAQIRQSGRFENGQQMMTALERGLREAIDEVLQEDGMEDTDRLYFNIGSRRLQYNFRSWGLTVKTWREEGDVVNEAFRKMVNSLNSNESFMLDDSFTISIVRARLPVLGRGKRRNLKPWHKVTSTLKKRKHSVIAIKNKDDLCLARALVTAKAKLDNSPEFENIKRGRQDQEDAAALLHYEAGVRLGPCGYQELEKFQAHLKDYRIIMVNAEQKFACQTFAPEGKPELVVLYEDKHFDTITSLEGFFGSSYFCSTCLKPHDNLETHMCKANPHYCLACKQPDCKEFSRDKKPQIYCEDCNKCFYGETCFKNHKTKDRKHQNNKEGCVCNTVKKCKECGRTEVGLENVERHQCGHTNCPSCREYVHLKTHKCYIQTKRKREENGKSRKKKQPLYVFFDIEAMQMHGQHEANLVIAETMESDKQEVFEGKDCMTSFLNWVDGLAEDDTRKVTLLAHNLQGYDGYFVVRDYYKTNQNVDQIRNGAKILQITHDNIRFIDSYAFIAMPLSAFPKTFGISELKKGYFPHLFNRPENQTYVGPIPAKDYYMPEGMFVKGLKEFEAWHEKQVEDNVIFDFTKELEEYCRSDVRLLKEGCKVFMKKFQENSSFNPFECVTIASACNRDLRENHLAEDTIAVEPPHGWFDKTNQSKVAREWLHFEQKKLEREGFTLQHRDNGGEFQIPGTKFKADGYCPETNTVYEFNGCYWHGCQGCYQNRYERHLRLADCSFQEVYQQTKKRSDTIRSSGFKLIEMWGCQWDHLKKTNPEINTAVESLMLTEPLNPRDAFSGGRTNATKLFCSTNGSEKIRYIDYTSLYPFINKTAQYPTGYPEQITNPVSNDITSYFGFIKCKIVAPYGLYHPVLPSHGGEKLTFLLCNKCATENQAKPTLERSAVCSHSREERTIEGTWCTPELQKAVEVGYEIVKIHEVWHFEESQVGLFESYVNNWLKIKQEASGWPAGVETEEEKTSIHPGLLRKRGD